MLQRKGRVLKKQKGKIIRQEDFVSINHSEESQMSTARQPATIRLVHIKAVVPKQGPRDRQNKLKKTEGMGENKNVHKVMIIILSIFHYLII